MGRLSHIPAISVRQQANAAILHFMPAGSGRIAGSAKTAVFADANLNVVTTKEDIAGSVAFASGTEHASRQNGGGQQHDDQHDAQEDAQKLFLHFPIPHISCSWGYLHMPFRPLIAEPVKSRKPAEPADGVWRERATT